ncbi:MAG: FHA domain-containing protein [Verrucomicrobia bacterium]|nr:FHA domain-containing protein [Verrucomicrobiota bacterium]
MIQLRFLTGKLAGSVQSVERFPCAIGRNASSDLRVEDAGVWDRHLELDLDLLHGFTLRTSPDAFVCVNGQRIEQAVLKNGDLLEFGGVKIQFWLNQTRQRSLRTREFVTWAMFVLLSLGQVALIYWLPK